MKKLVLLALLCAFALLAWHAVYSYRKYNVILITTDTLRSDHLSCYNPDAPKTPNFDRLAAEGVLFENAYTTIPITLPAHTAILTSHAPHNLGLFNNGETYDGRYPLLPELLHPRGYHTAAFISLGVLKREFGLAGAFDDYEDHFDDQLGRYYKTAEEVNREALPWIEKEKDHPFFAWIHYSDPHEPYITTDAPPDTEVLINGVSYGKYCIAKKEKIELRFRTGPAPVQIVFRALTRPGPKKIQEAESRRYLDHTLRVKPENLQLTFGSDWRDIRLSAGGEARYFEGEAAFEVAATGEPLDAAIQFSGGVWGQRIEEVRKNYLAEVHYLDQHLGELLDRLRSLGLEDRTIIIWTSDHGEGLKTHGYLGHTGNLHNEVSHVPLVVRYPNLGRKGARVTDLVNHLDITPTILDFLRSGNPKPMEGASLKRYVSYSPIDMLLSRRVHRSRTFVETYTPEAPANSFALVEGNMKLIFQPTWRWEIYDTAEDRYEKRNLAKADPARFQSEPILRLRRMVEEFSTEALGLHSRRKNPQLDEAQKEMLHTLGYVNTGEDNSSAAEDGKERKDQGYQR